jgi:hypothetical protein
MVHEDEIALAYVLDRRAHLHHPADGCVAILNREAEAASERRKIEPKLGRDLAPIDQHLGSLTQP